LRQRSKTIFSASQPIQGSLTEGGGRTRETWLKEKAQYSWSPCTNLFKLAPFYIEYIIYIFNKTRYLNEKVNCIEPPPSLSIPWLCYKLWSRNPKQKCSLVEWVILALEIGEFQSWGNHQLCGYGSMTRGQMITSWYSIVLEKLMKNKKKVGKAQTLKKLKGRLSTVDLLVLTSLDQLLFDSEYY
jgi:hypothetical protein